MKTPSFLPILILFAALPAAADIKAGERCDREWLDKTQATLSKPGRVVTDAERIETVGEFVKLKFGSLKTCDASTWRHLATLEPISGDVVLDPRTRQPVGGVGLRWRNPAAATFWKDADAAQQVGVILAAGDFYAIIDEKAKAIVTAGDAVIDAAKALGFAEFTVSDKSLAVLSKGTSGGATGAIAPRLVTMFEEGKQKPASIPQEQFGPTLRKLVNDGPTLGDAVVDFRIAVLGLEAELGRLGKSTDLLQKRLAAAPAGLNDFTPGLPKEFVLVAADKAGAMDKDKYGSALAALVGPGELPKLEDQGLRGAALLDPVDLGLRNLIAIRSAQVDQIFEAAKKRLGGKTLSDYEAGARINALAGKEKPGSLSEAVIRRLGDSPDYKALDTLYEDRKRKPDFAEWSQTIQGKGVLEARDSMIKAAQSATVEAGPDGKVVVFTQRGSPIALPNIVPSSVDNAETRDDVAGMISRFIVAGEKKNASNQAAFAAIGGKVQVGAPMDTVLNKKEGELARTVPEIKKIKDGAAGCDNPKDLARNDYETYAARQRAAAAAMSGENTRERGRIEKTKTEGLAAAAVRCEKLRAEAAVKEGGDFDTLGRVEVIRTAAKAKAEEICASEKAAIITGAETAVKERDRLEAGDRNHTALRKTADADLEASFREAISASVETLRRDYTNPAGGPRIRKLVADAKLKGPSDDLYTLTATWFAQNWPAQSKDLDRFKVLAAECAGKLGFKPGSDQASYRNPENPDNVAKACGIEAALTESIIKSKGAIFAAPPSEKKP